MGTDTVNLERGDFASIEPTGLTIGRDVPHVLAVSIDLSFPTGR